jgi:dihydrofolate reductase
MPGMDVFVYSKTLRQADYPAVAIINTDPAEHVRKLKAQPRKNHGKSDSTTAGKTKGQSRGEDIWLFGGGELFRTLLDAGVVDTVELAIMPVLIGGGLPMLPPPASLAKLSLTSHRLYPKSGIMLLEYTVIA